MQMRIRWIWSFITRRKAGNTSAPAHRQDSPSGTWYSTLDLPLHSFIHTLVDSDLSFLVISGHPSENELLRAWEKIYELFLDAMADRDGLYKVRLLSKINKLKINYQLVELCIQYLKIGYKKSIEDALKALVRLDQDLDYTDRPRYLQLLQTAKNRSERMQIDIESYEAEYAIITKRDPKGGNNISHEHFSRLIAQVSLYAKFRIDRKKISAAEFCAIYSEMRDHSEFLRRQSQKTR